MFATLRRSVLVLVIGVLVVCSIGSIARHVPNYWGLRQHRALWAEQQPAHYRYTFVPSCLCSYNEVVVEVDNGALVSVTRVQDGQAEPLEHYRNIAPIQHLFELIEGNFDSVWMRVDYDSVYGYPLHIDTRHFMFGSDTSSSFTVRDFQVL